ncbi:cysteine desulfurase family protein [Risungbinella massiliensis]|uniref:cysteine desulfurase family protein n=1 Tax=Risungbinella massiliensis TaxID=1329796 RepID=UPI0005CBC23B|nr:cysteine desulfurase family protein [Risungbinella massiliensis]
MAIYLDHAATTPIDPQVREEMLPFLSESFGNPSSIHQFGREVRLAIDTARQRIATAIGAQRQEIIFTSGGTEADNTALMGVIAPLRALGKNHLITTEVEHHAVLDACAYLEQMGTEVTYLPVDSTGRVSLEDVKQAIRPDTALVSIMYGNNEVGTIQPIEEIGSYLRQEGILFHTDAVQAFGLEEMNVRTLPVDLVSLSSHKIYGPKGVGALYVRQNVMLHPRFFGGSQERRKRAGTENVPGIIGFGKAAMLAVSSRMEERSHLLELRKAFLEALEKKEIEFVVNGNQQYFLPHILNISFPGTHTETMLMNLDIEGIACASGSACTSGTLSVSHVLKAMKLPERLMHSAIRFSFGKGNTKEQVIQTAETIARIVQRIIASDREKRRV